MLTRRRLFGLLRVGVSVGLLALILRTIDLYDQVERTDGAVLVGVVEEAGPEGFRVRLSEGEVLWVPAEEVARDPASGAPAVRYGLLPVVRRVDLRLVAALTLGFSVVYVLVATRWRLLLRAQGMEFGLGELLRLVFIGMLFNNVMLGSLGGDVVKAYFVARRAPQRAAAVLTVFLDRVLGMLGLMTLCLVGTVSNLGDPRFRSLFLQLALLLGVVVATGAVFLSTRLRRLFHVEGVLRRLPFRETVAELDRALVLYRRHRGVLLAGFLLSLGVHLSVVLVNWALGWNLGLNARLGHYFSLVPVALTVAALPVSIAGWGVGEWAYAVLFSRLDPANWTRAMALSVLFRVSTAVVWSMLGAVFLIRGERPSRGDLEEELAREEALLEGSAEGVLDGGRADG